MSRIDSACWLGPYPFRHVPHHDADGLLRWMDRHEISQAVVSSLPAVFHRDPQPANTELARWVAPHRDRLIPCATLHPHFPGWRHDLKRCAADLQMRGLRLFPKHAGFTLTDPHTVDLVRSASELGWHTAIPIRLEDRRGRHWMDTALEVTLAEIADLARRVPECELLVIDALGVENSAFVRDPSLSGARVGFEISRMAAVLQKSIPQLLDRLGPDRLYFGTGMPLKVGGAGVLKLDLFQTSDENRALIAGANIRRLLRRAGEP